MQYFRADKVAKQLDISKATLYRFIRGKKFPSPIRLSTGTAVWPESDVNDFIEKMRGASS